MKYFSLIMTVQKRLPDYGDIQILRETYRYLQDE
jgi:hypothetical protein